MAVNNRSVQMANAMLDSMLNFISTVDSEELMSRIMPKIDEQIEKRYGFLPQIHEVHTPTCTHTFEGVTHEKFDEVLQIVNLNIPVYLTGKAGTGKNVICKQVAEALGLDFYFTNAVTQEYKLTGFIDANGVFQETQFYKAFTHGGLFFLDEIDASIPEVLIILNAAIANRYFDFPIGKVEAHPDFRVIAAGNTVGTGADNNYTGRFCLDRASLDRFAMISIDYSDTIEQHMARGKDALIEFTHAFRDITEKAGIECLFSYRTIDRISQLEEVLPDLSEVISISLFKGLDDDSINIIKSEFKKRQNLERNKYVKAILGRAKWNF